MTDVEGALERRARRAYERGRVWLGLRATAPVVPMAALSLLACGRPAATIADAVLLAGLMILFVWRGEAFAQGARLGLWAGLPPLLMPLVVALAGHVCGSSFCPLYPSTCLAGGVAGGVLLGWRSWSAGLDRHALMAGGLVAGLAGTLGCLLAGTGGLIGLGAGLLLGAGPVVALRRA